MIKSLSAAFLVAALAGEPVAAVSLAYNTPATTPGNQVWLGTLALNFNVNEAVTFNVLGGFDSGKDGITSNLFVTVFNAAGAMISPLVNLNGTANPDGAAYVTTRVADFTLTPGSYQLAAWGFTNSDSAYNAGLDFLPGAITFNSFGGALTATGSSFSNPGVVGQLATIPDIGATRYGAGTIGFVPEPASWALLLSGFGLVGFAMRRRTGSFA